MSIYPESHRFGLKHCSIRSESKSIYFNISLFFEMSFKGIDLVFPFLFSFPSKKTQTQVGLHAFPDPLIGPYSISYHPDGTGIKYELFSIASASATCFSSEVCTSGECVEPFLRFAPSRKSYNVVYRIPCYSSGEYHGKYSGNT